MPQHALAVAISALGERVAALECFCSELHEPPLGPLQLGQTLKHSDRHRLTVRAIASISRVFDRVDRPHVADNNEPRPYHATLLARRRPNPSVKHPAIRAFGELRLLRNHQRLESRISLLQELSIGKKRSHDKGKAS